ncbi:MAG: hypothetical protein IPL72_19500 [Sulfuritalea sp.]|nr:hypothetical protein [Sulfuritalea sp.]
MFEGILGKYAKQLDTTLDDGQTAAGNMRVITMANPGHTQQFAGIDPADG